MGEALERAKESFIISMKIAGSVLMSGTS